MTVQLESSVVHSGLNVTEQQIKTMVEATMKKIAMAYPAWADVKIEVYITAKHE